MSKSRKNNERNWEESQNFKSYKKSKMNQEEDIDVFRCVVCREYNDSYNQSEHNNVCIDCFDDNPDNEEINITPGEE